MNIIYDLSPTEIKVNNSLNKNWWNMSSSPFQSYRLFDNKNTFYSCKEKWLSQFDKVEASVMTEFLLNNLLYIQDIDIEQCTKCLDHYIQMTAYSFGLIKKVQSFDYEHSVLFGLSDGARLDLVRYFSNQFQNHQFSQEIEISLSRVSRILKKTNYCNSIILLDDFSGSGISYLRYEENQWKGKLIRFYHDALQPLKQYRKMQIFLVPYYATAKSVNYLNTALPQAIKDDDICWILSPMHYVPTYSVDSRIETIMQRLYQSFPINDFNYNIGKHNKPFLGFNETGTCLVMQHNTPNNTFPILWHGPNALFPRKQRHRSEG